jgi:hypothetical protein
MQAFLHERDVRHQLKNVACLSFIPESSVAEEFEKLQEEAPESITGLYQTRFLIRSLPFSRSFNRFS